MTPIPASAPRFRLKHFRAEGCISYIIWDPASREGAVIDPVLEIVDEIREFFQDLGIKARFAVDTHIHADHYSGTQRLKDELGAEIVMSDRTRSLRPTRRVKAGDLLELGSFSITVIDAEGHTPDSICLFAPGALFTGDTLLIGSTGRTDFPGSDPGRQWDSIQAILRELPGETLVYPGHDYSNLLFSTLTVEESKSEHLTLKDRAAFIATKQAESIPNMQMEIARRVEFNLSTTARIAGSSHGAAAACGAPVLSPARMASISVEKYSAKLKDLQNSDAATVCLDVREPQEFFEGRIPGTRNIPLSELGLHLGELRGAQRVYVSCLSGRRSALAVGTLEYLGIRDAVNVVGGYKAWTQANLPVHEGD